MRQAQTHLSSSFHKQRKFLLSRLLLSLGNAYCMNTTYFALLILCQPNCSPACSTQNETVLATKTRVNWYHGNGAISRWGWQLPGDSNLGLRCQLIIIDNSCLRFLNYCPSASTQRSTSTALLICGSSFISCLWSNISCRGHWCVLTLWLVPYLSDRVEKKSTNALTSLHNNALHFT